MSAAPAPLRAEARVDLGAIRSNVAALRSYAPKAQMMAVVKADAYGHGLVPCARAAVEGGATWLATALVEEALRLRQAGLGERVIAWLYAPGEPLLGAAVAEHVDLGAYAPWAIEEIAHAARAGGHSARVHLKVDTGLSRGGSTLQDWPALVDAARRAQADGTVEIAGIYSHFVEADSPGSPLTGLQVQRFGEALAYAEAAGLRPEVRHLANSAGTLLNPESHFDLVRCGISVYGLSPSAEMGNPDRYGLVPAMTLVARLALVKRVPAGSGVSYGHLYRTERDATVGLVPLGYADGIPFQARNAGPVLAAGRRRTIAGRVCMDQVVLDLGDDPAEAGDEVVLFGPGAHGEPTVQDWAVANATINYEIVTRLGPRVVRTYVDTHNDPNAG